MKTDRKKAPASLIVNMTPLIDVVFLIIVFFIMIMNFSEVLTSQVVLPKADEAKENLETGNLSITVKSEELILLGNKQVSLNSLEKVLSQDVFEHQRKKVQLRGDENVPYDVIQKVMQKIAATGITQVHFSTRKED